tara:strand:+ start:240 stop:743 length:504 start_codon:yes stop_codon:yes gene_type:complete
MINKINKLSRTEFIKLFANIFEKANWIAEKLYEHRPFNSFEGLSSKMLDIFETASDEKKLKILNDHPDLADKTKINQLTSNSFKEQTNSGLDQCTEEEYKEFNKLNNIYKKFGFPFILAIKGKNKIEIIKNFRKRVLSDPQVEYREALTQVKKIANLRLKELIKKID